MWVQPLGWEDPLEKKIATHFSNLAWEIPWTEQPRGLQSMRLQELDTTDWLNHHHHLLYIRHCSEYFKTRTSFNIILCVHMCAQPCPTLCNPMDCSPPGCSVHGISQARILEWVAISSCRGSSQPRDWIHVSCLAGGFFTTAPPGKSWIIIYFWLLKLLTYQHFLKLLLF